MHKLIPIILLVVASLLGGCKDDASVASYNISKAADMFEVQRRIVFYNGITGQYMLELEGRCSIEPTGSKLAVTCKYGDGDFRKHYLGLSDNVTYFAEQLGGIDVSVYHTRIVWKPQSIVPEIDLNINGADLVKDRH